MICSIVSDRIEFVLVLRIGRQPVLVDRVPDKNILSQLIEYVK